MFIRADKCLVVSSGPKDIGRSTLIQAVKEEANLKLKNWKIQYDQFDPSKKLDVNIIIFTLNSMSEEDYESILECADSCFMMVLGKNDDKWLHRLIPMAEEYHRWTSICEYCDSDACHEAFGNIVCRECKIKLETDELAPNKALVNKQINNKKSSNKRKAPLNQSSSSDSSSVIIIEPKRANNGNTPPTMTTIINCTPDTTLDSELDF